MVNELNEKNFESVVTSNNKVVLDFYADWCGPCQVLKPEFAKLAESNKGNGIYFGSVDIEENDDIVRKYGIRNLPTILFLRDGEVIGKQVGFANREKLAQALESIK